MPGKSQKVDIKHIAELARLKLNDDEISRYESDLSSILSYAEQLSEVDLSDVTPTAHAVSVTNVLRRDTAGECMDRAEMLNNAPDILDEELIKVPVVISNESEGNP